MTYEGGCLCGAVRYRITGEPLSAGFCHCRMCQRAAGATVVAWMAFRRDDFHFVKGEVDSLRASARATRRFCPQCGTALTFEYAGSTETVDVTIASLDDATEPVYRMWSGRGRQPWFHVPGSEPPLTH